MLYLVIIYSPIPFSMKKLVSIKTDETGEILYFTHKKGVDTIRKSEVVDLELLEPKSAWWNSNPNDRFSSFQILIVNLFVLYTIIYFSYSFNWNLDRFFIFVFFSIGGSFILNLLSGKRNTRRNLRIYALNQTLEFEISDNETYKVIYHLFKKEIAKYLPKGGELFMFEKNPSLLNYHKFFKVFHICLFLLCSFMLISVQKCNLPLSFIIINMIIAVLGWLWNYWGLKIQKGSYSEITFEPTQFRIKMKWSGEKEHSSTLIYDRIKLINLGGKERPSYNGDKIKIIYVNDSKDLPDGLGIANRVPYIFDVTLQFSEEFRDLTPIMIEYINELSEKQMDNDLTI
jgi:hypothetical protein